MTHFVSNVILLTQSLLVLTLQPACNQVTDQKPESQPGASAPSQGKDLLSEIRSKARGIYVASDWQKPIPDYVLENPEIDGVFLRLHWSASEPAPGKYDWAFLDSEINRIVASGKKISLGFAAGSKSPKWLYDNGIPGLEFVEIPRQGKSENVRDIKIPIPWNEKYLNFFNDFIINLAGHLKKNQNAWNAISMIKITGINETTIEIRLPSQKNLSNSKVTTTDAPAIWKKAGYTPELVMHAWKKITGNFCSNFEGKALSLAIIGGRHGFPPINSKGEVVNPTQAPDMNAMIIEDGVARCKNRFVLQHNSLQENASPSETVVEASRAGIITGFQLNQHDFGNPGCLENNSPCDEKNFQFVLEKGFRSGAEFIEIFPKDVLAFPKAIANAKNLLAKRK